MDLNRATILGRLTRDPEVRTTPNGKTVASLTIVTNRTWTDQTGAKQEKPEFHNCDVWGRLAEIVGQYMTKGRRAYLEGRIETRDWTGQDGVKRYRTELIGDNLIMLDGPRGANAGNSSFSDGAPVPAVPTEPTEPSGPTDDEIKVEDIPF